MRIFKNFSISVLLLITAFSPLVSIVPQVSAARIIDSANLGGKQSVIVKGNAMVNVNMTVTSTSPSNWFSTKYKIGNNEWICIDTANHKAGTTATIKFQIKAPSRPGKYTVLLKAYGGNDCTAHHGSPIIVLTDGIVIEGEIIPPKPKGDLSEYSAVILNYPDTASVNYTNTSWQTYQQALNTNIVTTDNTQAEIDTAVNNIKIGQSLLLKKSNLNSYNGVLLAYPESFSYLYTNTSWNIYKNVLDTNAVNTEDTQNRVDEATQKISEAQNSIVIKADLTEYRKVLEQVPTEAKNSYTEDSWNAYILVLEANNKLTTENTQAEVDNVVDLLKKAQSLLVKNSDGELQGFYDPTIPVAVKTKIPKNKKTPKEERDINSEKANRLFNILNGLQALDVNKMKASEVASVEKEIQIIKENAKIKASASITDFLLPEGSAPVIEGRAQGQKISDAGAFETLKQINQQLATEVEKEGGGAVESPYFMALQLAPEKAGDYTPNDPLWHKQTYLHRILETNKKIWNTKANTGSLPVVAVIDAGVDFSHPDLFLSKWTTQNCVNEKTEAIGSCDGGYDFVGDDKDPYPTDGYSHGTAVASIIGASADDGMGISSVSRGNVKIMSLRVADYGLLQTDDIVRAILFAVHNGAEIINMSFAGPTYSKQLEEAIRYAQDHGVYMVTSAGNYGFNIDETKIYPASFNNGNLITVGALDGSGNIASFSNYGKTVDVFAEGVGILSAKSGGEYGEMNGTSFSAPIISAYLVAKSNDNIDAKKAIEQLPKIPTLASYSKNGKVFGGGRSLSGAKLSQSEIDIKLKKDTEGNSINPQSKAGEIIDPKTFVPDTFSLQALSAPQLLAPGSVVQPGISVAHTNGKVTFYWSAVSGALQYGVHVRDNVTNELIVDCNWPSCNYGTNFTPNYSFIPGRSYRWNMVAYESNGTKGVFSSLFYFTVINPATVPATPTGLTPGYTSAYGPILSGNTVTISWNPVSNATHYLAYIADLTTGLDIFKDRTVYGTSTTSPALALGHRYVWGVRSVNAVGTSLYPPYYYFQTQPSQNTPPSVPTISGSGSVNVNNNYNISMVSTDGEGDRIWYQINWGDGTMGSTAFNSSGTPEFAGHTYSAVGSYCISVRAFDYPGLTLGYSPCNYVTVKTPPLQPPTMSVTPAVQTVGYGEQALYDLTTTYTSSCSVWDATGFLYTLAGSLNGRYPTRAMFTSKTFTMKCVGLNGSSIQQNFTVNVSNTLPKVTFSNIPNTRNGDTNTITLTTQNIPVGSVIDIVPLMGNINPQHIITTGTVNTVPFTITSATGSIIIGAYYRANTAGSKFELVGISNSFTVSSGAGCLADTDLARQDLASFIDLEKGEIKSLSSLEGLCLPQNPDLGEPYLVSPGREDKNNPEIVYGPNQTLEIAYVPNAIRYEVNIRDISVNNELTVYKTTGQFVDVVLKEGHNYTWNANAFDSQNRSGWFADRKYFNVRSQNPNTPPTISVTPTTQTIEEGTDGSFVLSSTNTTSCDITGAGLVNHRLANGDYGIGPMYRTAIFTFRCIGSNGQAVSQDIIITVNKKEVVPPPGIPTAIISQILNTKTSELFPITINTTNIADGTNLELTSFGVPNDEDQPLFAMGTVIPKTVTIQNNTYTGNIKVTSAINKVKLKVSYNGNVLTTSNTFDIDPTCYSSLSELELSEFELSGLCTPKNIYLQNPEPLSPGKAWTGEEVDSTTQTFKWTTVSGATKYALYVRNMTTGNLEVDKEDISTNSYTANLNPGSLYYWHIRAKDSNNQGGWLSEKLYFKTKSQEIVPTTCTTDCFSNVMFFPGIMGSRLYEEKGSLDCGEVLNGSECFWDKELWVSLAALHDDHRRMALDSNGKKIYDIYTKEDKGLVEEVPGFIGLNIYKSFADDLKDLKNSNVITDYSLVPYDWRLSLEDIITNGKVGERNKLSYADSQNFSESFILKKLRDLQSNSKSGKVTLIGHSNGGLVIKALIQKLKENNDPLYDKIDKVIFVATPQVGTPEGFLSLLHGTRLAAFGAVMTATNNRYLAENMPTTYNLLPSKGYFDIQGDPSLNLNKIITFPNHELFSKQTEKYGTEISNFTEFKDFILGKEGREKPTGDDLDNANNGNENLYNNAEKIHQMLDNWQAPENTKVIQVAGWGIKTFAGIEYMAKKYGEKCEFGICGIPIIKPFPKTKTSFEGDETVVTSSALWMNTDANTERWWVDLKKEGGFFEKDRTHKDILEVSNLRNFIKAEIKDASFSDPENIIVNSKPNYSLSEMKTDIVLNLYSGGYVYISDSTGRITGIVNGETKEEIPNSRYMEVGNTKYISVEEGIKYTVHIDGNNQEMILLDVDKEINGIVSETKSLQTESKERITLDLSATFDLQALTIN